MNEKYDKEDIKAAIDTLRNGGIIVYPTDTIWGIGCDAKNEAAVKKVFEIKRRADSKSMILLVDAPGRIPLYSDAMPDIAWDLIECADTPTTIIYSKAKGLAPNVIAEDGSVGIRVTKEKFSHALCERFGFPIVSTSANISGEPSAKFFAEISEEILNAADYVVKFRRDDKTPSSPSKIIKIEENGVFKIIR